MQFVPIDAGIFTQGSDSGNWDEKPARVVHLTVAYEFALCPVSNAEYEAFDVSHHARRGAYSSAAGDDDPVVCVNWAEASAFCVWLSQRDGCDYRLPTEAEWEFAVRTQAAKLHDLTRVENWCADWYGPYAIEKQTDPAGYANGDFRVTRGGPLHAKEGVPNPATRLAALPADGENHAIGIRLVRVAGLAKPSLLTERHKPRWASDVAQAKYAWKSPSVNDMPFFAEPISYVHIPESLQHGPLFTEHNHVPGLTYCDNGDLLAVWYSTIDEAGRELAVAASRLRAGSDAWEEADLFWDAPNRNDHAPALWNDGQGTLLHFNGLAAEGGWENLVTLLRISRDNGANWTAMHIIAPTYSWGNMPIASVFRRQDGAICLPCDAEPGPKGGTALLVSRDARTWARQDIPQSPSPIFEKGKTGPLIAGIHAAVAPWTDSSLVAVGRGDTIDGRLALSVSRDGGHTWMYFATPFDPIGGGQRPILRFLPDEKALLFVSFTKGSAFHDSQGRLFHGKGLFAALSYDGGSTWPVRRFLTDGVTRTLNGYGWTHEFTMDATHAEPMGYLTATQTPDGMIHLISSGVYYRFNAAWLRAATPPAAEGK